MNLYDTEESQDELAKLRAYHTPKLDELRKALPEINTSNLIQHMIHPQPLMVELTGWKPPEGLALVYPSPDKMEEIQMTLGAALLAVAEEIDARLPPRVKEQTPPFDPPAPNFGMAPTKSG